MKEAAPVLVSSCLLGMECRYDGGHCRREDLLELLKKEKVILICPEQMGGLSTPREAAEIMKNGKVFTVSGKDGANNDVSDTIEPCI